MRIVSVALLAVAVSACAYHSPTEPTTYHAPVPASPLTPSTVRVSTGINNLVAGGVASVSVWVAGFDHDGILQGISGVSIEWAVASPDAESYRLVYLNNTTDPQGFASILVYPPVAPQSDSVEMVVNAGNKQGTLTLPVCRGYCAYPAPTPLPPLPPLTAGQ